MAETSVSTEKILAAVDAVQEEAIEFLKTIVSIDSTLEKGEGRVQSTIHDHLIRVLDASASTDADAGVDAEEEDAASGKDSNGGAKRNRRSGGGFEVRRMPVRLDEIRDRRGFSPVDWEYDDDQKFNVIARHRGCAGDENDNDDDESDGENDRNRSLLLLGHVDVVPASESDGWTDPPFSPVVRDDGTRLYGRGSGDMKAGVVAMIYAIVALKRMGYRPRGELAACTVVEEECTGNGALAAPLGTLLPDSSFESNKKGRKGRKTAVVIPEPFPFVVTAQMGVLWFRAAVTGRPCHVLETSAGSNAIEGAYALYSSLEALEERYNEPRGEAHPAYRGMDHPVNFNLGRIEGGNWASSVPSSCTFEARVGFFPGVEIEDVKRDVETTLHEAARGLGLGLEISYRGFHADGAVLLSEYVTGERSGDETGEPSLQSEFVETLQKCHSLALSSDDGDGGSMSKPEPLPLKPITCTCDARFYSSLYQDPSRVAVTCFGPEAANIHGVDESVSLKSLRDVTATMALFIRDWCGLVRAGD